MGIQRRAKGSGGHFKGPAIFILVILCVLWWSKGFDLGVWVYGFLLALFLVLAGSDKKEAEQEKGN